MTTTKSSVSQHYQSRRSTTPTAASTGSLKPVLLDASLVTIKVAGLRSTYPPGQTQPPGNVFVPKTPETYTYDSRA